MEQPEPKKSALFVDFDNIYLGLRDADPAAAERFATNPSRWLSWFENGMLSKGGENQGALKRSILIRRCYPNPDAGFRRHRSFFTSAAFTVIDCPATTKTGKNSADIHMVMDILDTLSHPTHFDEFIILSGDSDFMPVLLRLRAHNRRTTTVSVGIMTAAYRSACDRVISEETFIESALGVQPGLAAEGDTLVSIAQSSMASESVLGAMARRLYDYARTRNQVDPMEISFILKEFREFRTRNDWLGFGTSLGLAEALVQREGRLELVRTTSSYYLMARSAIPAGSREEATAWSGDLDNLRNEIAACVKQVVAASPVPLTLAKVSGRVTREIGDHVLTTHWAGANSFKKLLQSIPDLGLEITSQPDPGYILDPRRHLPPIAGQMEKIPDMAESSEAISTEIKDPGDMAFLESQVVGDALLGFPVKQDPGPLPSLDELALRVHRVTGFPHYSSSQYKAIFQEMAEELRQVGAGETSYNTYASSQAVSRRCSDNGLEIKVPDAAFLFKGMIFQDGGRFGTNPGSYTPLEIGKVTLSNALALCRRAQLELSPYEERLLEDWVLGGIEEDLSMKNEEQLA